MYAAEFEYASPPSLEGVISLLDRHGDDAKLLAGGQSLVPMMNLRLLQPGLLIDVNRVPVPAVHAQDGALVVPAGTRHAQLLRDPLVARHAPVLAEAARHIGNVRVRSRGTIGGSVAHGDPTAELPCVLTALDAIVVARGRDGVRAVPARDLFLTYLTTSLEPTEVVTEVRVPVLQPGTGQAFVEYARRANDFAVVEAAAVVQLDAGLRCTRVALVLGGVHDTPLDVSAAAAAVLRGEVPSPEGTAEVGRRARAAADPHDDVHGTAAYRLHLIETLGRRALDLAVVRARGEGSDS